MRRGGAAEYPFGVQLNVFDCGGVAIGVCFSHKIVDWLSCIVFINSWAAMTRGQADVVNTHFLSPKLFPPVNLLGYDPDVYITKDKDMISKRFVFSASVRETLKENYVDDHSISTNYSGIKKSISRVEALSAFIWSRFLAITQSESDKPKDFYALLHNVNLRSRMEPPLPEYSFGNYYREVAVAPVLSSNSTSIGSQVMVRKLMDQIKKIDKHFIEKLRVKSDEYLNVLKEYLSIYLKGGVTLFEFTSLCRFPLYDVNFGWGKPIWVGVPSLRYKNQVLFADTESGGGFEACINLQVEDMAKFEKDNELFSYVSSIGSK